MHMFIMNSSNVLADGDEVGGAAARVVRGAAPARAPVRRVPFPDAELIIPHYDLPLAAFGGQEHDCVA